MRQLRWIEWLPYIGALLFAFLIMYGCASTPQCMRPIVTLERPILPVVPADKLQCLDNDTYAALVDRELRLREYAEQCEAVVKEVTQ